MVTSRLLQWMAYYNCRWNYIITALMGSSTAIVLIMLQVHFAGLSSSTSSATSPSHCTGNERVCLLHDHWMAALHSSWARQFIYRLDRFFIANNIMKAWVRPQRLPLTNCITSSTGTCISKSSSLWTGQGDPLLALNCWCTYVKCLPTEQTSNNR